MVHLHLARVIVVSTVLLTLLAAVAVVASGPRDTSADSTFNPVTTLRLCNAMDASFPDPDLAGNPACTENLANGTPADVTVGVSIPATDVHLSRVVSFSPNATNIASGASMPAGTKLGGLRSLTTLAVLGGPCSTPFTIDFVLYNVALPNNPSDPRLSTNLVYPRAEGQTNRFGRWEFTPNVVNPVDNVEDDTPSDGRADSDTLSIQNYPAYLLDAFDPDFQPGAGDGPLEPLVPKAVYGGMTSVFGGWIPIYFVQFASGALTVLPGPFAAMTAQMGQPSVSVLGDPTATTVGAPSSQASEICTPANITTVLLGEDVTGVHTRAESPASPGTYFMVQHLASQRDLDQDGFENLIDTCPKHADVGSPKDGSGDLDGDRIDDACDPTVSPGDFDEDNDLLENRVDTCPLDVSTLGDSESTAPQAADKGPDTDQIGNVCDTGMVTATVNGRPVTFTLSATIANGRYHTKTNHVAKCFGGTDADGDGYCSTQESGQDSNPDRHTAWGGAFTASSALLQMDTDGDGWSDAMETYLGTDPTKACQQSPEYPVISGGANNEGPLDNWPLDFDDNQVPATVDVGTYVPRLGLTVSQPPADERWDLQPDGIMSTLDIGKFVPVLNRRCDVPTGSGGMGFATYSSQTQ